MRWRKALLGTLSQARARDVSGWLRWCSSAANSCRPPGLARGTGAVVLGAMALTVLTRQELPGFG
jgi:hypothetical protein